MPIHEYSCLNCGFEFEFLLRSAQDEVSCPRCKKNELRRLISKFAFSSGGAKETNVPASSSGCASCSSGNCASCRG